MTQYLLNIAKRTFFHDRLLAWINIVGLSVALAASLIIVFYVQHETSYDKHWPQAERIYRLNNNFDLPGRAPYRLATTSSLLVPAVQQAFPDEVELAARARSLNVTWRVGEATFKDIVVAVDPAFGELFALDVGAGSLPQALGDTAGIALREDMARKLFGTVEVLGRTVTIEYPSSVVDYRVTAVYTMPAYNTVLELPALIRFDEALEPALPLASLGTWYHAPVASYLKLKPGVDPELVRTGLDAISDNNVDVTPMSPGPNTRPSDRLFFDMSRISDLHLDADFQNVQEAGNRVAVQAFSVIAALIMLIACINFAYLTLARSERHATEVGIRRILGASKGQLVLHYLRQSCVLVAIALVFGLVLVEVLLPTLGSLLALPLQIDYARAGTYVNIAAVYLLVALFGGVYPALMLSNYRPAQVLGARSSPRAGALLSLKNALLVFQFGVAIALIVATSVIYLQVELVSRRDPGFRQQDLILVTDLSGRQEVSEKKILLRERMAALPNVTAASLAGYHPLATTTLARVSSAHVLEGREGESFVLANTFVDEQFFPAYDIALVAGRNFSLVQDVPAGEDDDVRKALINQAAARFLGFSEDADALGNVFIERTTAGGPDLHYTIIGVVADNQFYSLKAVTRPEIYFYNPALADVLAVRYTGDAEAMLQNLSSVWREVMGDAEFTAAMIEPLLASAFTRERGEGRMFLLFSLLAMFIACLGLFGASAFSVERRTREIGIRKVLGAQIREILALLMWQFSIPVLLANVLAWPAVVWAMLAWLQKFPYQIDTLLLIPLCVLAGAVALSIAWLTVAGSAWRAASQRPVLALRYE